MTQLIALTISVLAIFGLIYFTREKPIKKYSLDTTSSNNYKNVRFFLENIGALVRKARHDNLDTQKEFAKKCSVSQSIISRIESNDEVSMSTLLRVITYLEFLSNNE